MHLTYTINRTYTSRLFLNLGLFSAGICLMFLQGCEERRPTDELAQAVTMGEKAVAMKGTNTFFDGKISASVTISRGIGKGRKANAIKAADMATQRKTSSTNDTAFLGGGDGTGGGASPDDNSGRSGLFGRHRDEGKPQMADIGSMENDEAMAYLRAKAAVGSPMPPVTIRLKLENTGTQPITVSVMDFNSDLGNFAIHPEVIKLAIGESLSPDPMISQLGITSDEIPVQVRLKIGTKSETKTIVIKNLLATSNAESVTK